MLQQNADTCPEMNQMAQNSSILNIPPKIFFTDKLFQKKLTPTEFKILELLVAGDSTSSMITKMAITKNTLKSHLRHIYSKAGVSNRTEFTLAILKGINMQGSEERSKRLQAFIEQSQDGIIIINQQGTIVEWNQGEEQITGIKRAEALGQPIWEIQHRLTPEELRPLDFKRIAKEKMITGFKEGSSLRRNLVEEIQCPDGIRRTIQSKIFAIPRDDQIFAGAITRDVTDFRK
jgi:PAS domain S-box-containing protein